MARQSLDSARVIYHLEDINEEAKCEDGLMQLSLDSFFTAHAHTRNGDKGRQDKEEKGGESEYVSTD